MRPDEPGTVLCNYCHTRSAMPLADVARMVAEMRARLPEMRAESAPPSRPALLERVRSAEGEMTADRRDGVRETDAREAPMCPMAGCGVSVERPKCLFELGSDCPRHEVLREFHATAPMRDTFATPAASGALPPVPVGHPHARLLALGTEEIAWQLQHGSETREARIAELRASYLALLAHDGATPEGGESLVEMYRAMAERANAAAAEAHSALATAEAALAAERERAEANAREAARGRFLVRMGMWRRYVEDGVEHTWTGLLLLPGANLSCRALREDAIDAAMRAEDEGDGVRAAYRAALASSRAGTTGGATTDG